MIFTDDPIADFERNEAEKEEWLMKLPTCSCCGEPIQDEKAVYYNDQWCCKDCSFDFLEAIMEDFMEKVCDDD